jgi:geranylgeranyl diphosphate synthase, type II
MDDESYFLPLREKVEREVDQAIKEMGDKTQLRDACAYALTNGGKRYRPLIVLLIGEALPHKLNVMPSALAVEFFHTASLIADDLPCMDDDDMRRNKPSLHKAFDESIAILASYSFISHGYYYIHKNAQEMAKAMGFSSHSERACAVALKEVSSLAGIFGATNGQYLDLFPPDESLETFEKIIYQKTITLFEISFILGWLFGGGQIERLDQVKKCAYHLGMAFQIGDDLSDIFQDKDQNSNVATFLGAEKAIIRFISELESFEKSLRDLGIYTEGFERIQTLLFDMVKNSVPKEAAEFFTAASN